MGTREVYEEKLRRGNLYHDPTIKPGLGTARCPRCLSRINPIKDKSEWEMAPIFHHLSTFAGSAVGGGISAVHGYNKGMPFFQRHVKGFPYAVGIPALVMYCVASAAFGGYALPKLGQFSVTTYYASSSASHYGISLLTRDIEDNHISQQKKQLP